MNVIEKVLKAEMSGTSKKMEELKAQMSKFMTEDEMYRQEASVPMDEDEDGMNGYWISLIYQKLLPTFHFQRKNIHGQVNTSL